MQYLVNFNQMKTNHPEGETFRMVNRYLFFISHYLSVLRIYVNELQKKNQTNNRENHTLI